MPPLYLMLNDLSGLVAEGTKWQNAVAIIYNEIAVKDLWHEHFFYTIGTCHIYHLHCFLSLSLPAYSSWLPKSLNFLVFFCLLKDKFDMKNKNYRYLLSSFIKKNKQNYYNKFFESNWNKIENTRKGIKFLYF